MCFSYLSIEWVSVQTEIVFEEEIVGKHAEFGYHMRWKTGSK